MSGEYFTILGHITDHQSGLGVPNLRVEAWDKEQVFTDLLGSTATDAEGAYQLALQVPYLEEAFAGRRAELLLNVLDSGGQLIHSTEVWLPEDLQPGQMTVDIVIDSLSEPADDASGEACAVHGRIVQPDGQPVEGFTVKAFDKDLRQELLLGEATTGDDGSYSISYSSSQLSRPDKTLADLVVRAYGLDGEESAASPVILGAPADQVVELVVGNQEYRGPSEYAQVQALVDPLLGEVNASGLNEEEVAYLAAKTGLEPLHVAYYVKSARLEAQSDIDAEVYYGLFRQNLPTSLAGLIVQDPAVQRRALEAAVRDNLIGAGYQAQVDEVVDQLADQAVEHAFQAPSVEGLSSLGDLLGTAGVSEEAQRAFLKTYQQHQGTIEEFWTGLRADPKFGDQVVDALQLSLQLGVVTQNHLPLVKALQAAGVTSIRELAGMTASDWEEMLGQTVDGQVVGVPTGVPGDDLQQQTTSFVQTAMRMMGDAFPTDVIASRIRADDFPQADAVLSFLSSNPDFDFRTMRVDQYLAENTGTLSGVEDQEGLAAQLKSMRCLFNVVPRFEKYEAMKPLLADGVGSALAIQNMGESSFLSKYSGTLGADKTAEIYANAGQTTALAVTLLAENSPAFNYPPIYVMEDRTVSTGGTADLETLFGSLDLCECEHCRSVYSPAAYLVDLMHMLKERKASSGKTALDVLYERRSDLGEIELTCKNTNTVMPYVDLVNEVLENAVAGTNDTYQTVGTDADLRVYPENLNPAAYDILANKVPAKPAVFPWSLPFSLWAEEARAYLDYMGAPRYTILEDFSADPSGAQAQLDIATEYLGLTTPQRKIITSVSSTHCDLWGVASSVWNSWMSAGEVSVSTFLKQSGLRFKDLQELCDVEYLNPAGSTGEWQIKFLDVDCDTTKAYLENISAEVMDRIQRFVRLQQALGWSIRELAAALRAIPPNDLSDDFLVNLSYACRIREKLNLPLKPLLSFWANIDTTSYGETSGYGLEYSLYETLFLSKSVASKKSTGTSTGLLDPLEAFELNAKGDELETAGSQSTALDIADYASTVQAALGVSAKDLILLAEAELKDTALNLANLTTLYRAAVLAWALKLSIRDFLSLRDLCGVDPFDPAAISAAWEFLKIAELVSGSGFSITELDYLLRHRYQTNSAVYPSDKEVGLFLADLRSGLDKIAQEYAFSTDPDGTQTAKALMQILDEDTATKVLAILDGTSTQSSADQEKLIGTSFSAFISDTKAAKEKLFGTNALKEKEDRFDYVLGLLMPYLCQLLSETLVKQKIADALSLKMEATELLLDTLVLPCSSASKTAMDDFLALAGSTSTSTSTSATSAGTALDATQFADQFEQYRYLDKLATVITKCELTAEELEWIFEQSANLGWLDLTKLPMAEVTTSVTESFEQWSRMAEMVQLDAGWPSGEPTIFKLLRMPDDGYTSEADYLTAICDRTGWLEADLTHLMGTSGFSLTYPDDYLNDYQDTKTNALAQLLRFERCFRIIKRVGMSAEQIWGLSTTNVEEEHAHQVRQAVRANYTESQWLKVAEPLRDALREKQRSALVDYLVHKLAGKGIRKDEDLFGYFLIDVKMSPCMQTSRIKQAISSVQLFIQRCFLKLETEVSLTSSDAKEWEWMKNYRVWEANRKVFLYPENWIEPELRDDKSPFFEDLENELLQCNVTQETVEPILLAYLEKLDQVARLEICGLYEDKDMDILHVFGRTRSIPHIHFYRRWVEKTYWTPWEPVDLDIEGDHLVPVVYNRRLHLFWPLFEEKIEVVSVTQSTNTSIGKTTEGLSIGKWTSGSNTMEKTVDVNGMYYQVKLAWSEYKEGSEYENGKWLPKRVSSEWVRTPSKFDKYTSLSDFYFRSCFCSNGDLVIAMEERRPDGLLWPVVKRSQFRFLGCGDQMKKGLFNINRPDTISGTQVNYMALDEKEGSDYALDMTTALETQFYMVDKVYNWWPKFKTKETTRVLARTPGTFRLMLPQQYRPYRSQAPFFYEDDTRTFFVVPYDLSYYWSVDVSSWKTGDKWYAQDKINLNALILVHKNYATSTPDADPLTSGAAMASQHDEVEAPAGVSASSSAATPGQSTIRGQQGISILALSGSMMGQDAANDNLWQSSRMPFVGSVEQASMESSDSSSNFTVIDTIADVPEDISGIALYRPSVGDKRFRFETFYHPYVCLFVKQLNRYGIDGLLKPKSDGEAPKLIRQLIEEKYFDDQKKGYKPTSVVDTPYPLDDIDFHGAGAYSHYNWELFFHAPFLIANHLSSNQRFDEAQGWYHYIFDPTDVSANPVPNRYWKIKPFFTNSISRSIQKLMLLLKAENLTSDEIKERESLENQIKQWRKKPFKPHLIARLRISAYQKAIVMKYLDNLIAWGDNLFRRDTIESINEATQLYILAAQILGRRPEEIPTTDGVKKKKVGGQWVEIKTFNDLAPHLDAFSNALVDIEAALPANLTGGSVINGAASTSLAIGPSLFFCIPKNDHLFEYWDTVADRLFKIRHCMNIEGIVRSLALFEPPIDPALLVRAVAAGVDLSSVLQDLYAPLPFYRFQVLLQKAAEICADVKALGGALLSALEKYDAEALALLRSSHEVKLLKAVREVKKQQVDEAEENLDALVQSKVVVGKRKSYYEGLLNERLNAQEQSNLDLLTGSAELQQKSAEYNFAGSVVAAVPDITMRILPSYELSLTMGTSNIVRALQAVGQYYSMEAGSDSNEANLASIRGGHSRREVEWQFQAELAELEETQIDEQIAAAEIRVAIAEQELKNHDQQTENAKEIDAYMRSKFTNKQLYSWMTSRISTLYFQSYQLAYDLAKRAEKSYQRELGVSGTSFIQFGYWDSLKKGLLAGERLGYDLKRMEVAYLEKNKREYEITKHISLAMLHPEALIKLRETGECYFNLPEEIFDLDYPGHYMRRIKTVSLSIPCVTGPYTNVSCTLTLQGNRIRTLTSTSSSYKEDTSSSSAPDSRFSYNVGGTQSIVTSRSQEDSGMFELNLRDERYLPFEGAGVISNWHLALPDTFRQFDYDTISDVIVHLRYTARDGGSGFQDDVNEEIEANLQAMLLDQSGTTGLFRLFSLRQEFPDQWYKFGQSGTMTLDISEERFPYMFQDMTITIDSVQVIARMKEGVSYDGSNNPIKIDIGVGEQSLTSNSNTLGGESAQYEWSLSDAPGVWTVTTTTLSVLTDVEDMLLLCHYMVA